jgi:hypothetical protein
MRKFSFAPRRIKKTTTKTGSYIQPAAKTAPARAAAKRAILESLICVESKMALFAMAPDGTGSKPRGSLTPAIEF